MFQSQPFLEFKYSKHKERAHCVLKLFILSFNRGLLSLTNRSVLQFLNTDFCPVSWQKFKSEMFCVQIFI